MPETTAPADDVTLARFQLACTHVLGHPALADALRHAVAAAGPDADDELELSTSLARCGIELPWGSTAVLLPARTDSSYIDGGPAAEGPAGGYRGVRVCVMIGDSLHCIAFHPPVVITVE